MTLLRTPFHQFHLDQGAKMVEFAGWEMPILYTSIVAEHQQVRSSGGLFDVSHMGRIFFKGPDARRFLEKICTRRVHDMAAGQCRYSLVCNERGGCRDDVLIYRFDEDDFMLVVNASNRAKLLDHFRAHKGNLRFEMDDRTEKTAMLALQGPKVMDLIAQVSDEIPVLKNYRFAVKNLLLAKLIVSRTGYTGEDGVEVILPAALASKAIPMAMEKLPGVKEAVKPAGLGARDTLRLEAGMPLYGHEMDEETDPISAGLLFGINLDKDQDAPVAGEKFIGQEALQRIQADGPRQKLVGLNIEGRRTARQGMTILSGSKPVGRVTSGATSPTLDRPIAMGYVPAELSTLDTVVQIDLGKATTDARVTALPFYKRPKKSG